MQLIPRYLYKNQIDVVSNDVGFIVEYRPVYSRQVKVYKGVDNKVQFRMLNADQKPVDINGKVVRFEAFDEETPDPVVDTFMSMHRKVPVKMKLFEAMERARKDPSVHPGIGSRHIFDTPFGHSTAVEPTISGTNALFPLPNPRPVVFGQQFQIADPKQMARLSRDVDDEDDMEGDGMFHAEAYQMPGVQTELVSPHGTNVDDKPVGYYSRAMANVPTFRGMPFNEETYFTTGEPMDLAFRLLKTEGLLSSDTLER